MSFMPGRPKQIKTNSYDMEHGRVDLLSFVEAWNICLQSNEGAAGVVLCCCWGLECTPIHTALIHACANTNVVDDDSTAGGGGGGADE